MKSNSKITRVQHRVCKFCGGDIHSSSTYICQNKECRRKIANIWGMNSYWHIRNNPEKWKRFKEKIKEYQRVWINNKLKIKRKVGSCLMCGIKLEKGTSYKKCDKCRKRHVDYCNDFQGKRIDNKLCIFCSKPRYKEFVMCEECNKKNRDKTTSIIKRKLEEGLCYSCNTKTVNRWCDACYLERKIKIDLKKKGNCWRCFIPLEKGTIWKACDKCREWKKLRARERRRKIKASPVTSHHESNPLSPTHTTPQSQEVK